MSHEAPIYVVIIEEDHYPSGGTRNWEFATGEIDRAEHYAQAKVPRHGTATIAQIRRLSDGAIYFDTVRIYLAEDAAP